MRVKKKTALSLYVCSSSPCSKHCKACFACQRLICSFDGATVMEQAERMAGGQLHVLELKKENIKELISILKTLMWHEVRLLAFSAHIVEVLECDRGLWKRRSASDCGRRSLPASHRLSSERNFQRLSHSRNQRRISLLAHCFHCSFNHFVRLNLNSGMSECVRRI